MDLFRAAEILLTAQEMRDAEKVAMKNGAASLSLMEKAGAGAAEAIQRGWDKRSVLVICGPGNNGGDGFVIADALKAAGWPVRVGLLGDVEALKDDARIVADRYIKGGGTVEPLKADLLDGVQLIIDALFGTGLTRPIEGKAAAFIDAVNAHPAPVVAIDLPSGINADTGGVMGTALEAQRTLTFFRAKIGHFLFPGRAYSGAVDIVDIGIDAETLNQIRPQTIINGPQLWGGAFPRASFVSHKYTRGGAAVFAGPPFAGGAARLAGYGALRAGAGIVTLLAPRAAAQEHAAHLNAILLRPADTSQEVSNFFKDARYRAGLIGPGAGVGDATAQKTLALLI